MPTSIFEQMARPPASVHLGARFVAWDPETNTIRAEFLAGPEHVNAGGFVHGGVLASMLDETMGSTVVIRTKGALFPASIDINVSFLATARIGRIHGIGQLVQLGKTIAFLQGSLHDDADKLLARGTCSARLVKGIFD